jgi:hypothetical protein
LNGGVAIAIVNRGEAIVNSIAIVFLEEVKIPGVKIVDGEDRPWKSATVKIDNGEDREKIIMWKCE